MRRCDFCGEEIQPVAKKCRHCGEVLDPALRAAEEAKRLALAASGNQVVITNNVSATAVVGVGRVRASWWGRVFKLVACVFFCFMVGGALSSNGYEQAGLAFGGIGALLLVVGVPLLLLNGLLRILTG